MYFTFSLTSRPLGQYHGQKFVRVRRTGRPVNFRVSSRGIGSDCQNLTSIVPFPLKVGAPRQVAYQRFCLHSPRGSAGDAVYLMVNGLRILPVPLLSVGTHLNTPRRPDVSRVQPQKVQKIGPVPLKWESPCRIGIPRPPENDAAVRLCPSTSSHRCGGCTTGFTAVTVTTHATSPSLAVAFFVLALNPSAPFPSYFLWCHSS